MAKSSIAPATCCVHSLCHPLRMFILLVKDVLEKNMNQLYRIWHSSCSCHHSSWEQHNSVRHLGAGGSASPLGHMHLSWDCTRANVGPCTVLFSSQELLLSLWRKAEWLGRGTECACPEAWRCAMGLEMCRGLDMRVHLSQRFSSSWLLLCLRTGPNGCIEAWTCWRNVKLLQRITPQ